MKQRYIAVLLLAAICVSAQQPPATFKNPVIPGFHPDPSIVRVNDDYYLVNSSFEWFPGIPVYHSRDLVNWQQIGHVLTRPSQLAMKAGMAASNGIWAPTIRFNQGKYYVIVTGQDCGGNFFVTAEKPEGPWSEPVFLDTPGIDPELFFDDNGRTYYVGSSQGKWGPPRRWPWEDRIYAQEIILPSGKLIGEKHHLTSGFANNAKWCEGPHIYKIQGKYVLLTSEGGTWEGHSVTVHVADSIFGPYISAVNNPVLTHRHLGSGMDITTTGHADLVQTQKGDWWSVLLAVRPIEGNYRNLGRETFLTPVKWEGTQPVFNPGIGRVLMEDRRPDLPLTPFSAEPVRDDFDGSKLGFEWNFLRTPFEKWYTLEKGILTIKLRPETSEELVNPSLIARRQAHHTFVATTSMRFNPKNNNEEAGLIAMQNDRYQYRLVLTKGEIRLIKTGCTAQKNKGEKCTAIVATMPWKGNDVVLRVTATNLDYRFYAGSTEKNMQQIGEIQDGRILTSNLAGGFIGAFVGMYASSNGQPSKNSASYDWFEYSGK